MDFTSYIDVQDDMMGKRVTFLEGNGNPLGELRRTIFVSVHGSYLYGTDSERSDVDLKAVYLNDAADIITETAEKNRRWSAGDDKNGPEDVDVEAIELRKFLDDALDGQTYAVELLFTPEELRLVETDLWIEVQDRRKSLLSQNTKPFMGYCRTQAKKYSMKGQRLSVIEDALEVIEEKPPGDPIEAHLDDFPLDSEHVEQYEQVIKNQDEPVDMIDVVGKKFELHSPVRKMYESMKATHNKYGERSHRSKDGVDWKAVSHAYRVAYELIELLEEGELTFPRPRADFLKEVKYGEIPYERVQKEIPEIADRAVNTESDLPEEPNRTYWKAWKVVIYRQYVFNRRADLSTFLDTYEEFLNACESYQDDTVAGAIMEDALSRFDLTVADIVEGLEVSHAEAVAVLERIPDQGKQEAIVGFLKEYADPSGFEVSG